MKCILYLNDGPTKLLCICAPFSTRPCAANPCRVSPGVLVGWSQGHGSIVLARPGRWRSRFWTSLPFSNARDPWDLAQGPINPSSPPWSRGCAWPFSNGATQGRSHTLRESAVIVLRERKGRLRTAFLLHHFLIVNAHLCRSSANQSLHLVQYCWLDRKTFGLLFQVYVQRTLHITVSLVVVVYQPFILRTIYYVNSIAWIVHPRITQLFMQVVDNAPALFLHAI